MIKQMCFRQIFRPANGIFPLPDGWGDCLICSPSDDNQQCAGYQAVTIRFFEVEGGSHVKEGCQEELLHAEF